MRILLTCLLIFGCSSSTSFGNESFFRDLEEVYLTVFEETVSADSAADRAYVVAIGRDAPFGGRWIGLSGELWLKLAARLEARKVDLGQFVSLKEIVWQEDQDRAALIHKPTGREVWVYSISAVRWHGDKRVRVDQSIYHGPLAAGGCTLVLEKRNGKWVIVERENQWVS